MKQSIGNWVKPTREVCRSRRLWGFSRWSRWTPSRVCNSQHLGGDCRCGQALGWWILADEVIEDNQFWFCPKILGGAACVGCVGSICWARWVKHMHMKCLSLRTLYLMINISMRWWDISDISHAFIILCESALDAFFPLSQLVVRDAISCCPPESGYVSSAAKEEGHRFLGGGGSTEICAYPLEETDYKAGYDYSKYPGIHVAHTALYSITLVILSSFLLELLALVYLLGPKQFFKQVTYVVDLVIVAMSLSLEILLKHASKEVLSVIPGILIIFRVWRFVRIGHGLVASTYELQQHKLHLAVSYIEELE